METLHGWNVSLCYRPVEEQFYMIWPTILWSVWACVALVFRGVRRLGEGSMGERAPVGGRAGAGCSRGRQFERGGRVERTLEMARREEEDPGGRKREQEPPAPTSIGPLEHDLLRGNTTESEVRQQANRISMISFGFLFCFASVFLVRSYRWFCQESSVALAYYEGRSWELLMGSMLALAESAVLLYEICPRTFPSHQAQSS